MDLTLLYTCTNSDNRLIVKGVKPNDSDPTSPNDLDFKTSKVNDDMSKFMISS